jgi:hypothetical protein
MEGRKEVILVVINIFSIYIYILGGLQSAEEIYQIIRSHFYRVNYVLIKAIIRQYILQNLNYRIYSLYVDPYITICPLLKY